MEAGFTEKGVILVGIVNNRPPVYFPPKKTEREGVEVVAMNKIRTETI
jgi:hypothetical protein